MVTISIIGILSAIVYANFGQARASARDEIRKTDLKNVQLALELYKAQFGRYPASCNGDGQWGGSSGTNWDCPGAQTEYISGLKPDFIADLPFDPRTSSNRSYIYRTNAANVPVGAPAGSIFKLMAHHTVEVNSITSYNQEFARCDRHYDGDFDCPTNPQLTVYAVYSPGAETW